MDTPGVAEPAVTVEVVRRTWDQVVDRLRTIRRLTWTLVSENAQVLALDGTRLTLGFPTQGLADAFNQRGHSGCVQEAVLDTLGVDRAVVGVTGGRAAQQHDVPADLPATGGGAGPLDGGPDPAAPDAEQDPGRDPAAGRGSGPEIGPDGWPVVTGPAARRAPAAPPEPDRAPVGASRTADGGGARLTTADREPPGWAEPPGPSAGTAPPAAEAPAVPAAAARTAPGARDAAARTARAVGTTASPRAVPPAEAGPPAEDVVSRDDPSADDGAHGPEVLARLLGATVIEERPTGR